MLGKCAWYGFNEMRHSLDPVVSSQPDRIGCCCGLYTIKAYFVNSTQQSASQILPIPKRVCLNDVMTWPVLGKVVGSMGVFNSDVPVDFWTCPVAVPTLIFGAARLKLIRGAAGAKYRLLAPESTIAVLCMLACTAPAYDWRGGG